MSCFITSDQTVIAIAEGMYREGMIYRRDRRAMCEAMRTVNEKSTGYRYGEPCSEHRQVDMSKSRDFADEEVWQSCNCWLYQVETGAPRSLYDIEIMCSVRLLRIKLERGHLADGSWKLLPAPGSTYPLLFACEGDAVRRLDNTEWDLSA